MVGGLFGASVEVGVYDDDDDDDDVLPLDEELVACNESCQRGFSRVNPKTKSKNYIKLQTSQGMYDEIDGDRRQHEETYMGGSISCLLIPV